MSCRSHPAARSRPCADDDPAGIWLIGGDPGSVPTTGVRDLRQAGPRLLVATDRSVVSPPEMTQVREHGRLQLLPDGRMVWFEGFERRDEMFEGVPRVRLMRLAAPDDA